MAKAATKTSGGTAKSSGGAAKTSGIHKPVTPSADLEAVVGKGPMPRSEIISKIWSYIRDHKLQDAKDKRNINADAKLEKIFGKKQVTMFEMNKHVSAHVK